MVGDFMKLDLPSDSDRTAYYDLVFNAGVIEHYLDQQDRVEFLRRKLALTKLGGSIVCIVPSGLHPYRAEQRQLGWGGYSIPEVDYSPEILASEIAKAGARRVLVIPHNIAGYLLTRPGGRVKKAVRTLGYVALRVLTPVMPGAFKARRAYSYIGIGWKA